MNEPLETLTQKLGYQFKDSQLLQEALSHRSVKGVNNERLEYLGDSILNFVIAYALYQQFPNVKEGELSRLRASLVCGETLAEIAKEFKLGSYIRLGPGELKSGGHKRHSILADAVEAIIGAIYLESGMDVCQALILSWFETRIAQVQQTAPKDAKTRLQELLQANKYNLPSYQITAVDGQAHEQMFTVNCQVPGLEYHTVGEASSRRKAEQIAAEKFLKLLKTG